MDGEHHRFRCAGEGRAGRPAVNWVRVCPVVALEERGIVSELAASHQVAEWAYEQTEAAGGLTWLKGTRWSR
jgi:hypothetical protein